MVVTFHYRTVTSDIIGSLDKIAENLTLITRGKVQIISEISSDIIGLLSVQSHDKGSMLSQFTMMKVRCHLNEKVCVIPQKEDFDDITVLTLLKS